jgi:gamma-glutamylcyclotransferase (GGCT)/AIG2-like uncharacterized protein YtfP
MDINRYAFYGTLRRGMENHTRFADFLRYRYSFWVPGYRMHSVGDYPCVVPAGPANFVLCEIMDVASGAVRQAIHHLEEEAGYRFGEVGLRGERVGIFYFDAVENFLEVKSGDWVQFFGAHGR